MKHLIVVLTLIILLSACSKRKDGGIDSQSEYIEKDFNSWWIYHNSNIQLSSSFTALDAASNFISKRDFFELLTTGKFIALKLTGENGESYRLFELGKNADPEIGNVMKNIASVEFEHYKLEGTKFPDFNFTDLNGQIFKSNDFKDKIVVLKCWFIRCQACVAEMPELNELIDQYKNDRNIVFLSLASDSSESLQRFLLKREFKYPVISVSKEYFSDSLKISSFPTHFIIRKGKIFKVVNSANELKSALHCLK